MSRVRRCLLTTRTENLSEYAEQAARQSGRDERRGNPGSPRAQVRRRIPETRSKLPLVGRPMESAEGSEAHLARRLRRLVQVVHGATEVQGLPRRRHDRAEGRY